MVFKGTESYSSQKGLTLEKAQNFQIEIKHLISIKR